MPREIDVFDTRLSPTAPSLGWVRTQMVIPITLPAGTSAFEAITDHQPGYRRIVESAAVFTAVASTGAGATREFRIIKNAATVVATGTVTLASTATPGAGPSLTVTAANAEFVDGDTFTVDSPAAGAVAFTAGVINLIVNFRSRPQAES
jgi:hypothetical protein